MSEPGSHPIRNGVIATVVGGLILSFIPAVRTAAVWMWAWTSGIAAGAWALLTRGYPVPGWILLVAAAFVFAGIWRFASSIELGREPERTYVEDVIYGLKWRWSWLGDRVAGLWSFCPRCDAQLVYDDSSCMSFSRPHQTDFICEHCEHSVIGSVPGGDKAYAVGAVEREIRRRIRVGEAEL